MANSTTTSNPPPTKSMETISGMLVDGIKEMKQQKSLLIDDNKPIEERAIFLLGNTGSGKTTATQIIAGDLNKLQATFLGKGEKLLIIDENDRIGSTIKSKTLIPEYVVQPETQVGFWDCPGFDDNRGPEVDIAAMYFVKHALETTSSAKFLVTVSHSSVQAGNDRLDFDLVATHVSRLISSMIKLQPAIGLVVTKVGNYSPSSGKYLSDEQILLQIQEFLEKYVEIKEEDMHNCVNEAEKSELGRKIQFVEGILGKGDNSNNTNLYFVRSPEDCGILGEMSSVQNSRRKLAEMIDRLDYISIIPEDFRMTLKAETLLELEAKWIPENRKEISQSVSRIATQFRAEFGNIFHSNLENRTEEGFKLLNNTATALKNLLEDEKAANAEPDSYPIKRLYKQLDFVWNSTEISSLELLEDQQAFFQVVTNRNKESSVNFTEAFSRLSSQILELQEFYQLCKKTEEDIVTYSSQVNLRKWMEEGSKPWETGVLQFICKYELANVSQRIIEHVWVKMDCVDRKYLEKIVTEAIPHVNYERSTSSIRGSKLRLTVSGKYLKFSDVVNLNKWPVGCNVNTVSEISVVAFEKLFLDADLNGIGKEWHVSIISPSWQVILGKQTRKILLDGIQPVDPGKAADGSGNGGNGQHGAAGLPGGNGGSFFGVYAEIENPDFLLISANGGNGGKGQDGGNGVEGGRGNDATKNDFPSAHSVCKPELKGRYNHDGSFRHEGPLVTVVYNRQWFSVAGRKGGKGGDGGNAGNGGVAGNPGIIQIISINGNQYIRNTTNNAGKPGVAGIAGNGGIGGKDGCNYSQRWNLASAFVTIWWDKGYSANSNTRGDMGTTGRPGTSINAMATKGPSQESWRTILDYKTNFFGKTPKSSSFSKFYSTQSIINNLNTKYFAKEVEFVEEKFYQIWGTPQHQDIFRGYYDSLLESMIYYTSSLPNNQIAVQENYVLSILNTVVKGKLIGMRRAENVLNIVDTEGYFTAVVKQLETLKTKEKEKVIYEENSRFRSTLDDKVREAEGFIEQTVQPAIAEAQRELDGLNGELLQEINEYLREAKEDLEKRKELKRRFESVMWMGPLMSVLNTAGTLCSFMGPEGVVAGALINIGTSAASQFLPAVNFSSMQSGTLPPVALQLSKLSQASRAYYDHQINKIQTQINLAITAGQQVNDKSLEAVTTAAHNTSEKLTSFQQALNSENETVNAVSVIQLEQEVDKSAKQLTKLAASVAASQDQVNKAEQKQRRNEDVIATLSLAMTAVESVHGIAGDIAKTKDELERLSQFVKEAANTVKILEATRERFYDELLPALDNIYQAIGWETKGLPGGSKVSLSVKKWNVKVLLKMMRGYIHQFTNGLKVAEKFRLSLDSLDEALALLIEIYDHIEGYEEKKQFADFITNVNSLSGSKAHIQDAELRKVLGRLEFFVDANLFYWEYQKAMHAFKQWVFPFASRYLSVGHNSPFGNSKVPTALEQVAQVYGSEINVLNTELKKYKATTVIGDESLMITNFTSGMISTKPFYVWNNAEWQASIKMLLSGQPVHLKADVDMTNQDIQMKDFFEGKSAIKFKTVQVKIKANDEREQSHLNEKLNHFHMKLTHSGVSVYKVMGRKFIMFDKKQILQYSFERTVDGYVSSNVVSSKVDEKNADYLMSPYTWWTLQLLDATNHAGFDFNDLAEFGDQVDIELVGEGIYLDEQNADKYTLENLQLSNYYEIYEDMAEAMLPKHFLEDDRVI